MESLPFAGKGPQPSLWGYNWSTDSVTYEPKTTFRESPTGRRNSPQNDAHMENIIAEQALQASLQYANMPAALLSSLKREKKPFTYTPGGVDLSDVLNARLQKRIERKKKISMDKLSQATTNDMSSPVNDFPAIENQKQVLVMPTYNSPLNMYSMENALEALEVQAGLTVSEKSLSSPQRSQSMTLPRNYKFEENDYETKNVTQSKAFKVLQIITDTEEEQPAQGRQSSADQYHDEMRFTGIRDNKGNPSKFFHTLQKITGTEDQNPTYEANDREMEYRGPINSSVVGKQHMKGGFNDLQHQQNTSPNMQRYVSNQSPQFQPQQQNHIAYGEPRNSPVLRRPAAFLPAKPNMAGGTLPRFKSFHAPLNGPSRAINLTEGTDF